MAVTLTGTGGLFKRLGLLFGVARDVVSLTGGTATTNVASGASLSTRGTNIESYAAESPAVSAQVDGHWRDIDSFRSSAKGLIQALKRKAEAIVIRQVDLDNPLRTKDITSALTELVRQMNGATLSNPTNDINGSTISLGTQTNGTPAPTGTPKIILTGKNTRGQAYQTVFPETLRATCTADAQSGGGATARQEKINIRGASAVTDVFSYLYPGGSGCNVSINLVDSQLDNSGGNKLYNSDFDTITSSYPEDWVIASGTAGTHVSAAGSSDAYASSDNALKLTGSGGTTITLRQSFDTAHSTTQAAGGTPYALLPATRYAVCLAVKALSAAPAAGVLRVALVNSSGTVIADDFAVDNSFDIDLTLITTSFVLYTGVFVTPSVLPTSTPLKFQLTTSTAITNSSSVVVDGLAMTPMTSLYKGGPAVAAFASSTNPIRNDYWTFAITNTRGVVADYMERFFLLRDKDIVIPYDDAAGESVADSVVA